MTHGRNETIAEVEAMLGADGSRPLAEVMLDVLVSHGYVVLDAILGYQMADGIPESDWLEMLIVADERLTCYRRMAYRREHILHRGSEARYKT